MRLLDIEIIQFAGMSHFGWMLVAQSSSEVMLGMLGWNLCEMVECWALPGASGVWALHGSKVAGLKSESGHIC